MSEPTTGCLPEATLFQFAQGLLDESEARRLDAHLEQCADCRTVLAETAKFFFQEDAGATADAEDPQAPSSDSAGMAFTRGTRVSRYLILEPMAAGGAGVVYRAYDPQLRRRVAIKLFLPLPSDDAEIGSRTARLLGEAQAMARLSHPNVVNVYDAGIYRDRVFIVMELLEGVTLAGWLRARQRSWRDIVAVFLEAGRGLAAAHAANLVHRDFKPENVLIGADRRARVIDFGLATPTGRARPSASPDEAATAGHAAAGATSVSGTPAYMAPEQRLGQSVDARTDQFSFCVALHAALFGRHPFMSALPSPPPAADRVPTWLDTALKRGLLDDPAERFATLSDLLDEIARGYERERAVTPWRSTRARAALAIAALAMVATIWIAARRFGAAPASSCGNGSVEGREECDDGNQSNQDACLVNCSWARCGDGFVRAAVEQCDDGNLADEDGCSSRCSRCDRGNANFVWGKNGHCYSRYDRAVSWSEAAQICRSAGALLVTYTSDAEVSAVPSGLLAQTPAARWIGLHDETGAGGYEWITYEPLAADLLGWEHVRPSPGECIAQTRERWQALPCSTPLAVLCEDAGFVIRSSDNHAYRAVYREKTWESSSRICRDMGGELAAIVDADEAAFLGAHFFGTHWLGGIKRNADGGFMTSAGARFPDSLFAAGDPDVKAGRLPACLVLGDDHKLHDRPCDGSLHGPYGLICEVN